MKPRALIVKLSLRTEAYLTIDSKISIEVKTKQSKHKGKNNKCLLWSKTNQQSTSKIPLTRLSECRK